MYSLNCLHHWGMCWCLADRLKSPLVNKSATLDAGLHPLCSDKMVLVGVASLDGS